MIPLNLILTANLLQQHYFKENYPFRQKMKFPVINTPQTDSQSVWGVFISG